MMTTPTKMHQFLMKLIEKALLKVRLTKLFQPVKVPSTGFDHLLDSCSAYSASQFKFYTSTYVLLK